MDKYREEWLKRKGLLDPLSDGEKEAVNTFIIKDFHVKAAPKPWPSQEQFPTKHDWKALDKKLIAEAEVRKELDIGEDDKEAEWDKNRGHLDKKVDRMLDDEEIKSGSFVEPGREFLPLGTKAKDLWDSEEDFNKDPEDDHQEDVTNRPSTPANVKRPRIITGKQRKKMAKGHKKWRESCK